MAIKRVVIKIGSSSITDATGMVSDTALRRLTGQLAGLAKSGLEPILVTSGAIASGRAAVKASPRRDDTELQAFAAVGQGLLMAQYARLFAELELPVGQVLFTAHDFGDRQTYLNARNTLERLIEWGVIPVVNENDTTATEEISLGENDRLAALVATMLKADLLVLLTDTPGVFSADPSLVAHASLIEEVADVDAQLEAVAGESRSGIGTGGMASKIAAAKIASWSGVPCVIAGADEDNVLVRVIAGESVGTRIHARSPGLSSRKVWIAFALRATGRIVIDAGAAEALARGSSLLPVGVLNVSGDCDTGSAVEVLTADGDLIAKGLVASSALPEAIHRDDLVVLTKGQTP